MAEGRWSVFKRALAATLALAGIAAGAAPFDEYVRTSPKLSPAEEQKSFKLPPGFEIQLVAAEPEIAKPISLAFDAAGRLWVAETRFYPVESAADKTPRDAIRILSDFREDGRAQKIETFADRLNTPDAVAPHANGAIVFSIPNIIDLRDTDGDGRADRREVLYGPFETRDTHNMANSFRRGFDGWLYGGHGVANNTTVRGRDGHEITMRGSTFRFRADGSRIELVGRGQVNPFGICFDPLGNLYASDCHSSPIYQLLYGAFYPGFGTPHDGLGFGPVMMRHAHGSTAIAGLCYYDDNLWPEEFRANMFLGNVMTSRVNRDRLADAGSTRIAHEMPDLVSSSDPWFRPVDVQLGPDGALYIADFYNRIIAHVEVPLNHPGRDRESGRIWRLIYRGTDGKLAVRPRRDLTKEPVAEVIGALSDPNFALRLTALNHLADSGGAAVIAALRKAAERPDASGHLKVAALWILERLGVLAESEIAAAARDSDRTVRTHALRVLVERATLSPAQREFVRSALSDTDATVQRTAADALARHPASENLAPLLALQHRAAKDDTHLVYMSRKALRDQLLTREPFQRLAAMPPEEADARLIADVAGAIPSAEAAIFLLDFVQKYRVEDDALTGHLRQIARYAPVAALGGLASFVRAKFAGDRDFQIDLLGSVQQGLEQRGAEAPPPLREWGVDLARQLLTTDAGQEVSWSNIPVQGARNTTSPWFAQPRTSADGSKAALFLCSLPPGGESLTGILRSARFPIPPRLSLWLAGHDGVPGMPPGGRNLIRLRDADSSAILAQAPAPRNDLAQQVAWDLSTQTGRHGVIEIVDADAGSSYAWIAAGRFEPPVATVPERVPSSVPQRQMTAADLVAKLHLSALEAPLVKLAADGEVAVEARAAALRALLKLKPVAHLPAAAAFLHNANLPSERREEIGRAVAELNSADARRVLSEGVRVAPSRLQLKLAQALAGSAEGTDALLADVVSGKISPQLLTDRVIKDKVVAARPQAAAQITQLTAGLKPSERLHKLIDDRRDGFLKARPDPARGAQIFTQSCAVCHSIDGQGGNLGPQLDGVGHRGLERLCEDILDPNRNVDRVFRYSVVTLKNGEIISGLFRREEGDLLVFADPTAKELTVPKNAIQERQESDTSLMPEILAEALAPDDFYDLLAFLLSKSTKPNGP